MGGSKKDETKRTRGKDKSKRTYEKYGKHTNRHNRIKENLLEKRKEQCETNAEMSIENSKLYNLTGPEKANRLATSLCLQSLLK